MASFEQRPSRTVAQLPIAALHTSSGVHSDKLSEQWRSYGKARRRELIENDNTNNTQFRINPSASIQRYFSLAERVCISFRWTYLVCVCILYVI